MSLSIARSTIPGFVLTLAALLIVLAAPANAASKAKNKHTVYVVEQVSEGSEASTAPATPAPESSKETRTAANDPERMKVNVGDTETLGFQEFYPFPEPEAPVQAEATESRKTLYWVGAAGAALVAGVAAWFIFSSEPESQQPTAIVVP